MRRALLTVAISLAFTAPAQAAASWSAGDRGHRGAHRVYEFRCGAWTWIAPHKVFVPPSIRENRHLRWWCEANIPPFTRW